jgi:hypothetical protein
MERRQHKMAEMEALKKANLVQIEKERLQMERSRWHKENELK